jgi:hypothetical protein
VFVESETVDVPGWGTAVTAGLLDVREAVREVVAVSALACVTGVPGVGKSTAVAGAVDGEQARDVVWLTFRSRPTMPAFRGALWARLWPGIPAPRSRIDFEHGITRAFERTRRTVVLDRAEVLSREALEYFAALVEDPRVDVAVIAIGSPSWGAELSKRAPKLHSFAYRRVRLEPLTDAEARTVVPTLHPMWADTTAREITDLNHDVAGALRGWRHITARRLATPNTPTGTTGR